MLFISLGYADSGHQFNFLSDNNISIDFGNLIIVGNYIWNYKEEAIAIILLWKLMSFVFTLLKKINLKHNSFFF